ncbi:hypothetical protein HID58_031545 [Brassica napus]|uniref:Uncharacterized protein n=1 Tax=Brassica napus TaxID=3708 RepID=A0ABQ8BTV0_BRANA|nr:hypothetical protein HID58_031545 [Brassica napus]
MLNKGFLPNRLSLHTLLRRKTQLKETYKLLCRMKLKGCNPDVMWMSISVSNAGSLLGNDYHEDFPQKIRELNLGARLFLGGICE